MNLAADPPSAWPASPVTAPAANQVRVWRFDLEDPAWPRTELAGLLDSGERRRAAGLARTVDQRRFIVRHGVVRHLLAVITGVAPSRLPLRWVEGQRPQVTGAGLELSVSHSEGLALVAVAGAGARVGVDVETLRCLPDRPALSEVICTPRERRGLHGHSEVEATRRLLVTWTAKEAYLKAVGTGLATDPAAVEVSPATGGGLALLAVAGDRGAAAGWRLHALVPSPGTVGALAVARGHSLVVTGSLTPALLEAAGPRATGQGPRSPRRTILCSSA